MNRGYSGGGGVNFFVLFHGFLMCKLKRFAQGEGS